MSAERKYFNQTTLISYKPNSRSAKQYGKIVKNKRIKTEQCSRVPAGYRLGSSCSIWEPTNNNSDAHAYGRLSSCQKQHRRDCYSRSIEVYEQKLALYEKNKREVMRDLGRLQAFQKEEKYDARQHKQHFFTQKLKNSLKVSLIRREIEKENYKTDQMNLVRIVASNSNPSTSKPAAGLALEEERFLCRAAMDQQARLVDSLRNLKQQISTKNRMQIRQTLSVNVPGNERELQECHH